MWKIEKLLLFWINLVMVLCQQIYIYYKGDIII